MGTKNTVTEPKTAEKRRRGRKVLHWYLGTILLGILIALGIIAWICAALFDSKPLPKISRDPDPSQYQSCINKFRVRPEGGENFQQALLKDKTVELSKKEVNAILNPVVLGAREYFKVKLPNTTISDVRFENGALHADISHKNTFSTPFGNYLNMHLTLIPRVEDGHLYLDVKKLSVGTVDLSGDWIQQYIDKNLRHFEKTNDGKMIVNMLKGFHTEADSIEVTFNPMQVNIFIIQKTLRIFSDKGKGKKGNLSKMLELLK